ncbi:drug/metabolite transporter (DMT)-like permease [Microvirga flocculans]|uniref:Drug/metabolite transporter (DMT)-like permease n=1 Tax=Microvirga flocculans TaxID=217168 RepID=A0A7W6IDZ5_9HYPH|nr:DMT family transporter [Microvirga flocculans]MBB4039728.1 drug/metabolite transporter (DMT)-like permease [Microvirga flocculans]
MSPSGSSAAHKVRSGALIGIGLMLLGVFLFAVNDVMGKWLVATYSVGQVLLLRSIAALAILLPLMRRQRVPFAIPPQPGLHAVRITLSTLEVACFYWAVTYMPLADVMTYYLAGPIYVAAFAAFWLGEKIDKPRMLAIGFGFVGVLIALRPSPATLSLPALIALTGSIFYSLLMITTRKLRETHDATLVLGQILGALIFGLVTAPFAWVSPTPLELTGLFLLGIVSMAGHACVNRSLKIAPASVVAPYQYTLIVWAVVLGYLFFGDIVEFWTLVGAAVICGAGLVLLLLEREAARRGREAKDIETPVLPEA